MGSRKADCRVAADGFNRSVAEGVVGSTLGRVGEAREPEAVKLICGILAAGEELLAAARTLLADRLGPLDVVSEVWPFAHTHYYEAEIGPRILRQFVSFDRPFGRGLLATTKLSTNAWEHELATAAGLPWPRPVNLDPGYVGLGQLVLATTKDRAHRIYLGGGIYAEVTLLFEAGRWKALPWTYADYAAETYQPFLTEVRERLKEQRRRP